MKKAILLYVIIISARAIANPTSLERSNTRSFQFTYTVDIESKVGFAYSLELLAKCNRLQLKIFEISAQWEERSEGSSRFKILKWLPGYLKWYFYGLGTTWLKKGPQDVKKKI